LQILKIQALQWCESGNIGVQFKALDKINNYTKRLFSNLRLKIHTPAHCIRVTKETKSLLIRTLKKSTHKNALKKPPERYK